MLLLRVATRAVWKTPAIPRDSSSDNHIRHIASSVKAFRPTSGSGPILGGRQASSDFLRGQERSLQREEYAIACEAGLSVR